jgi:ribosomal 50S subunit-associated protein YjgA (DUF615 family)
MTDIIYKNYNEDEENIYKRSIDTIRSNINNGIKFDLGCELIDVKDEELRRLIIDDALKIEIAELHYGQGLSLRDVSKRIGVSMERLLKANTEMIEDIMNTSTDGFDQIH